MQRTTRVSKTLPIPRFGATESVLNDEVIGVRETGSMMPRTLQSLSARKQKLILADIQATTQWCMKCALDGKLVDPTNGLIVLDLHQELGTQQTVRPVRLQRRHHRLQHLARRGEAAGSRTPWATTSSR